MTPEAILVILEGLVQATPAVLALFQKASTGAPVAPSEVQAALQGYERARAALAAAIALSAPAAKP